MSDNKIKKYIVLIIILVFVLSILSLILINYYKNDFVDKLSGETEILINNKNIEIKKGESYIIQVDVTNSSEGSYKWISNDSDIAIVDNNGKVIGLNKGIAIIKVTYNDEEGKEYFDQLEVNVLENNNDNLGDINSPIINYVATNNSLVSSKPLSIKINVSNIDNVKSILYSVNCQNECEYKSINNGHDIFINQVGINRINILVIDNNGNVSNKEILAEINENI